MRKRAPKPLLKQCGNLTAADFELHPVWICVHGRDQDEPWYEETDEETFRPWADALPKLGLLLVAATLTLKDGRQYPGCVFHSLPAEPNVDIGGTQPWLFCGDEPFRFWGSAIRGVPQTEQERFAKSLGPPNKIFPIAVKTNSRLLPKPVRGVIPGFMQAKLPPAPKVDPLTQRRYDIRDLMSKGKLDDALAEALRFTEEHPEHTLAWVTLSVVHERRGNLVSALAAQMRNFELEPRASTHQNLARLHAKIVNFDACLDHSEQGLASVDNADSFTQDLLYFLRARSLYELGRYKEALQQLKAFYAGFEFIEKGPLWTKRGLAKACRERST